MKNAVFWDASCVALVRTDDTGELGASIIRVIRIGDLRITLYFRSVRRLLVTANVVPCSPILVTLMMEEPSSSETAFLTRATRRHIPFFSKLSFASHSVIHNILNTTQQGELEITPGVHCGRMRFRFPVFLNFFSSSPSHYIFGVGLRSNGNMYQESSWGKYFTTGWCRTRPIPVHDHRTHRGIEESLPQTRNSAILSAISETPEEYKYL
jgi:hypothetical protein